MALTQLKTTGLADDAVTGAKIADDTVAEANMANDAISLAELKAGTDGQIITYDASGNPTAVGPGSDGQVLTSTGAGSPPAFETLPVTSAEGTAVLSTGESGGSKFLREDGDGTCSWQSVPAGGIATTGGTFTGDVTFDNQVNAGVDVMWDESANAFHFQDGAKANFGASSDLSIQHVSGNSVIQHNQGAAGDIVIRNRSATGNGNIYIESGTGTENQSENAIVCMGTGQRKTKFYYQGAEAFSTSTGGLAVPDGKGIDFSAEGNESGMTSELLDDYEEGSFTPEVTGGGYTYGYGNYNNAVYTKIGREVHIEAQININSISGSSDSGWPRMTLPFSPQAVAGGANWCRAICHVVYIDPNAVAKIYCVQLSVNSSNLDIVYTLAGQNGTAHPVDLGNDWQSSSQNTQISFGLSYRTAT